MMRGVPVLAIAVLAAAGLSAISGPVLAGVVLLHATPSEAFDRAGLEPGDVLEKWRLRDDAGEVETQGVFSSPFDVFVVSTEHAPRGEIELYFIRGGARHSVVMPNAGWWFGELRPNWDESTNRAFVAALETIKGSDILGGTARIEKLVGLRTDELQRAWLLHSAASVLRSIDEFDRGERLTARAVAAAERANHPAAAAWIIQYAGIEAFQRGRADEGMARLEEALRRREAIDPNGLSVANTLHNLTIAASGRGEFDTARRYGLRAEAIREKLAPDSMILAETFHVLGNIAFWTDDSESAEQLFRRAMVIRARDDPGGIAMARNLAVLGNLDWRRGRLAEADAHFTRALEIKEKNQAQPQFVGETVVMLGHVAYDRRRLAEAEHHYLRALEIFQEAIPGTIQVADTLNALGLVAFRRLDDEAAEHYGKRALQIYESLNPDGQRVALVLHNLGHVALRRGNLSDAEHSYRRSLAIVQSFGTQGYLVASRLHALGRLEHARGSATHARELYEQALSILDESAPDSLLVGGVLTSLGRLGRETGRDDAEAQLRRAASLATQLGPGTLYEAEPMYELALLRRDRGETSVAIEYFEAAIDALEAQRALIGGSDEVAAGFAAHYERYYKEYVELLVERGEYDEAFFITERYRARHLLALLAQRDFTVAPDELPAELIEDRRRLDREYSVAYKALRELDENEAAEKLAPLLEQLRALRVRRQAMAERLRAASPRLAMIENPVPLDARSAAGLLDERTVLLSYLVLDDRTLVFELAAGREHPRVLSVSMGRSDLEDCLDRLRVLIRSPWTGAASHEALQNISIMLYAELVEPALLGASNAARILILPDGPLHLLPFAALRTKGNQSRYLIEDYAVQTAASATVFAELNGRHRVKEPAVDLVAFGDPVYSAGTKNATMDSSLLRSQSLGPLPSSRVEVETIAELFADSARLYVGDAAREERVKTLDGGARFVHFASHGVIDQRAPLDSFIALSRADDPSADNGLLQAWEVIEQVRLDADLVTLSACDTALGRQAGGEGLLGLTSAFQYAGASSVMASLWKVSDVSTSHLMTKFYANLKAGMPQEEALRQAQIAMIRGASGSGGTSRGWWRALRGWFTQNEPGSNHAHPYHWAGFVLNGLGG